MSMFGKPSYDNQSTNSYDEVNRFAIKGGKPGEQVHTIFRIIPPMHKCAERGVWVVWEPIHWGYYSVDKKDPTKRMARPFKCIKDKNTTCPECNLIEEYTEARKKLDPTEGKEKDKRTLSDEEMMLLAPLEEFLDGVGPKREGAHRLDKKWKLNVYMRAEQKAGTLRISSELYSLIKARKGFESKAPGLIDTYLKDGLDLIDANEGVWFNVTRTGSGFGTKDRVDLVKEKKGRSEEIVPAPILEGNEIYNAVLRDCKQDLNVCSFPVLNFDQINDLVNLQKSGDLDPEKIESIFKRGQKAVPPMKTVYREEDPSDDVPPNELFTESRTAVTPTKPEPPKSEPVKEVPPKKIEEEKKPETAPTASTGMSIQDKIAAMRAKAKNGVPQ